MRQGLGSALGGMDEGDPLASRAGASSRFAKVAVGASRLQRLSERTFLSARLSGQLSSRSLVVGEQLALGGADSVRGYPLAEFLGDAGVQASLEVRHALRLSGWPTGLEGVQVSASVDYGRVSTKSPAPGQPSSEDIASLGLGAHLALSHGFGVRAELGYTLSERPSSRGRFQPWIEVSRKF